MDISTQYPSQLSFAAPLPRDEGLIRVLSAEDAADGRDALVVHPASCAVTARYVSVTRQPAAPTRERTHSTIVRILGETALVPAAHLTCIGATRENR